MILSASSAYGFGKELDTSVASGKVETICYGELTVLSK